MLTPEEIAGLAAAVGRLTLSLKMTEQALAEVTKERDTLKEQLSPSDPA